MKKLLLKVVLIALLIFSTWSLKAQIRVLESFTSANSNWTVSTSGTTAEVSGGYLHATMAIQPNSKYRGDLQFTNAAAGSGITLHSATDVYIAIKFSSTRPNGALKYEMKRTDPAGGSGSRTDGYYNTWTGGNPMSVTASDGGYIYYYNLTSDANYLSQVAESKEFQLLKFIIADATAEPYSYSVDWVATFPTIADITTYKDYEDDSSSGIAINEAKDVDITSCIKNGYIYLKGAPEGSMVNIYSATGSRLLSTTVNAETAVIPFSGNGLFLIQVVGKGKSSVIKLVN